MKYLLAIFCPPLYFFSRGKVLPGIINGFFYMIGIFTILFGVGGVFLFCCAVHAIAYVKREDAQYNADLIGSRVNDAVKDALAAQDPTKNY